MPPTIRDIARKVGKSITTVSRALHDYEDVSPETKEMVRKAAEEMGYSPNAQAQRLQKRHTDTLGLILPTFGPRFSDPFFSEFLAGVGNKAAQRGFDLLVSTRAPGEEELKAYRANIQGHRVDGFILVRMRCQDARVDYLRKAKFPFVAFGRVDGELDFPHVDEDGSYGMGLVVKYLADLGHRRIASITAPPDLSFTCHRLLGVRKEMAELGLSEDESLVVSGDLTQRGGYQQASRLLDLAEPPTAIMAYNDLMAMGAMSAAQERGILVGKQISITGFDDIPMSEHSHPPLTTVHQPVYQIGSMVCEMLIQTLSGESPKSEQVILKPSLIVRQSCGPAQTP